MGNALSARQLLQQVCMMRTVSESWSSSQWSAWSTLSRFDLKFRTVWYFYLFIYYYYCLLLLFIYCMLKRTNFDSASNKFYGPANTCDAYLSLLFPLWGHQHRCKHRWPGNFQVALCLLYTKQMHVLILDHHYGVSPDYYGMSPAYYRISPDLWHVAWLMTYGLSLDLWHVAWLMTYGMSLDL